jgi:hypothetical protein
MPARPSKTFGRAAADGAGISLGVQPVGLS